MNRYFLLTFAVVMSGLPMIGCNDSENRTIETQGELWDERAAFYADDSNFSDEEYQDDEEAQE
ncbi:hypothetical protein SAMN06265222_12813 [Neorhodopirellula lusitana]|uniref:Secreted protein n=1 Tax=Neorhodopirellula lusitana TaxID=445327 RepID=A0ABY1QRH4_9BACT|nr:hypothetical protein [Neorhodopirellula lusitana]SMP78845.1 hypothetical protein SAMN06265222_12813 [Neorhodopirellula lusitana]